MVFDIHILSSSAVFASDMTQDESSVEFEQFILIADASHNITPIRMQEYLSELIEKVTSFGR
jgi:hypothetical protein